MTPEEKSGNAIYHHRISRRDFLAAGLACTAACLFSQRAIAAVSHNFSAEKSLSFYNIHTGESMRAAYWSRGAYVPEALDNINYLLRDYRTGEVKEIDTDLLDLLSTLHQTMECTEPFYVISGYRSPETNAQLSAESRGVAKNSLHMYGKAIDIRLPGYELNSLRRAAVDLRRGGVGYYPASDFVHVDVGRVRYW